MKTVFYIGDSTVARNTVKTYPQTGMSQMLDRFVTDGVAILSYAKNGRSTKSFLDEGRFGPVQRAMQPGDLLLIQFGHNDEKDDPLRHTDPDTTFRENLRYFCNCAREKGACPVLITPVARRHFDKEGQFLPGSHGPYPEAIRQEGAALGVPVIDLTALSEGFVEELGDALSQALYMGKGDNTHLTPNGALYMTRFLANGLEKLGSPYSDFLAGDQDGA